jgi:hypothetical protein
MPGRLLVLLALGAAACAENVDAQRASARELIETSQEHLLKQRARLERIKAFGADVHAAEVELEVAQKAVQDAKLSLDKALARGKRIDATMAVDRQRRALDESLSKARRSTTSALLSLTPEPIPPEGVSLAVLKPDGARSVSVDPAAKDLLRLELAARACEGVGTMRVLVMLPGKPKSADDDVLVESLQFQAALANYQGASNSQDRALAGAALITGPHSTLTGSVLRDQLRTALSENGVPEHVPSTISIAFEETKAPLIRLEPCRSR